jgi:hypothetical protein
MGLEDQVGEALEALEAPEVLFLLEALVVLEGGVQFLLVVLAVLEALEGGVHFLLEVLEALELEALEVGVQFLLEGLEARVALVLGALDLVASSGHGKLEPQLTDGKLTFAFFARKLLSLFILHLLASEL